MFIASRQKLINIPEQPDTSISGEKIERVKTYKCLDLELDEGLTWESHVSAIISKVSKVIGILRRLKPLLPLSALVLIYKSLIQPHFDYCSVVWDNLAKGLGQKLQRLQNRAARIIVRLQFRSLEILRSLNWTNLEDRRTQQFETVFKTFIPTSSIHEHNLRGSNRKFFVPRPLTESLNCSFVE